jgi:two-component SAPR family response regulator
MNGLQLYKKIKEIDHNIKVIFISALEATEELVSVLEGLKKVDVIKKPVDRRRFIEKVESSIFGQGQDHISSKNWT